jgi:two-component system, chemotaxis family, protein-glutamate methylesterase/glutaminase
MSLISHKPGESVMPIRVLVVDDSQFFQRQLKDIINENPELKVVGIASNGREAIDKAAELQPDIITMDFEMPVMDGVTAIRHIMANRKVPILMFSSLTYEGAKVTLDALAAGALDFIPKDFAEVARNSVALKKKLQERLITLAQTGRASNIGDSLIVEKEKKPLFEKPVVQDALVKTSPTPVVAQAKSPAPVLHERIKKQPRILVIGASTGGPIALADVLMALPQHFPVPILLVQHMPENFTKAFAERLNKICKIEVREAVDGDALKPGLALLAPGGKQLMFDKRNLGIVRIFHDDDRVNYKPSLDITFGSAANTYGDRVLGVVLTGMGSDGCNGARLLKDAGSSVWSQDEQSCVIYGMPMAVAKAGLTDRVLSLKEIGPRLAQEVTG